MTNEQRKYTTIAFILWLFVSIILSSYVQPVWNSISGRPTTISGYGITDSIVYNNRTYTNPSWITSYSYSKVSGSPFLAQVATDSNYSHLTNKPTVPTNTNQLTNGSGFITSAVTSVYDSSSDLVVSGINPVTTTGTVILNMKGAYKILRYGSCASNNPLKIWDTTIVNPSTAQGDSINFSYVGFTSIPIINCVAQLNTTNAGASPQISLKTASATGFSLNITNGSTSVVTLLSTVVGLGAASNFSTANLPQITLHISAIGQ